MKIEHLKVDVARDRFIAFNRERLNRTKEILRPAQKALVDLLPLFFHVNQNTLPGFINYEVPFGVSNYAVDENIINLAKRTFRGFDLQTRAQWAYTIEAIFLMGSVGTIAFSHKSDIDVWLCVKPELTPEQLAALQKKATAIEKWYEEKELEVHFFLMKANDFREGRLGELSTESSGSAQHKLLLDEFYRTAIWMAGKHPVWWFVPPDDESSHDEIHSYIVSKKLVEADECIDFGALPLIPADEFFGAAVWQLYKAVDSPYKSILKILLMEVYAAQYPNTIPLSSVFKKCLYDSEPNVDDVDPYVMLLRYLEEYLSSPGNELRRELIRRSFYIKVGISLSAASAKEKNDWRHQLMSRITQSWGWQEKHLIKQDSRGDWRINEVLEERKLLTDSLSKSYLFLSQFAKKNAHNPVIKQRELTILGRKLYSVFDKKPGKIELVTHGIRSNVNEDRVTVMLAKTKTNEDRWLLYRGKVTGSEVKNTVAIKTTAGLIDLLVWAYFNQVIGGNTQKLLYAPGCDLTTQELNVLLDNIRDVCPNPEKFNSTPDDLSKSVTVDGAATFINVGKLVKTIGAQLDKGIIAGKLDILKYGSNMDGFIVTTEMLYINSWKEVFSKKYDGVDGLMDWLMDFLSFGLVKGEDKLKKVMEEPAVFSFSSHYGHTITRRIKLLFDDARKFFFLPGSDYQYYVIEAAKSFYIIEKKNGKFSSKKFENSSKLLLQLSQPSKIFRGVAIDHQSLSNTVLPHILKYNKPGRVQVFYEPHTEGVTLYIIDENGAIYSQRIRDNAVLSMLSHYYWFIRSKLAAELFPGKSEEERERLFDKKEEPLIEFYSVKKEALDYVVNQQDTTAIRHARKVVDVKAVGATKGEKTLLSFTVGNREFSGGEQGVDYYREVATVILQMRQKKEAYAIHITELQLDASLLKALGAESPQTVYYLKYKKKIEDKLNASLQEKPQAPAAKT